VGRPVFVVGGTGGLGLAATGGWTQPVNLAGRLHLKSVLRSPMVERKMVKDKRSRTATERQWSETRSEKGGKRQSAKKKVKD